MVPELVIVKFVEGRHENDPVGRILFDVKSRKKIALANNRCEIAHPPIGSVWRCLISRDTDPGDKCFGALHVEPIHRLHDSLTDVDSPFRNALDCRGRVVCIGDHARRQLIARPHLARFIPRAVEGLDLGTGLHGGIRYAAIDVGGITGSIMWRRAPNITAKDQVSFAYVIGEEYPVRIIYPDAPVQRVNRLWIRIRRQLRRSEENRYHLDHIACDRSPKDHPLGAQSDKVERERLNFWLGNAYFYDPATMGKPFTSGWDELLEYEPDNEELRPEAEIRGEPVENRIPLLQ